MFERYLEQIAAIIHLCEDTDSILIVNPDGIVEHHQLPRQDYWKASETVGHHIQDLYPELTEQNSTILQALRTGEATYGVRQELVNSKGERVGFTCDTIPVIVDGVVQCVVNSSRFYHIEQGTMCIREKGKITRLDDIITATPAMQVLKLRIRELAKIDSAVLIYGETGTGKELVAEALHSEGSRAKGPFIAQNCAAIPSNLLESIFFGTEKGIYTGALDRKGLFEQADGGTLFLDEINSMDIGLQAKLLKALEEKSTRHLGGSRNLPFDVRIIAAVNEEPSKLIKEKRMRKDLYYRLGVIRFNLPPLRERVPDIPVLTQFFIEKYNNLFQRSVKGISEPALSLLEKYDWPGNIRELQNVIEGAVITASSQQLQVCDIKDSIEMNMMGDIESSDHHLSASLELETEELTFHQKVALFERKLICEALEQSSSLSDAARQLGLTRQNLQYKMQKLGL